MSHGVTLYFLSDAIFDNMVNFKLVPIMTQSEFPSFTELSDALSIVDLKLHASQVHGLVCGLLCGNPNNNVRWQEMVIGGHEDAAKTQEMLQALYAETSEQLKAFVFDLALILPDDEQALPIRAEALTLWTQGYLTGLKLTGVPLMDRAPSEVTEAIDDMIEIAKMNHEDVVASEEDEAAYIELIEFVRMAAILIYQELRESEAPQSKAKSARNMH